jgi:hypothetical protein
MRLFVGQRIAIRTVHAVVSLGLDNVPKLFFLLFALQFVSQNLLLSFVIVIGGGGGDLRRHRRRWFILHHIRVYINCSSLLYISSTMRVVYIAALMKRPELSVIFEFYCCGYSYMYNNCLEWKCTSKQVRSIYYCLRSHGCSIAAAVVVVLASGSRNKRVRCIFFFLLR